MPSARLASPVMDAQGEPKSDRHSQPIDKRKFHDLRRHNQYAGKVARMLELKRERRIERVAELQRKHRLHQAR
jgi:hypothetical protein